MIFLFFIFGILFLYFGHPIIAIIVIIAPFALAQTKWMARLGNIGGTARSVSTLYQYYIETEKTNDLYHIMEKIIEQRYDKNPLMKDKEEKKEYIINSIREGKISGLFDLVITILIKETSYGNLPTKTRAMYRAVILEELDKKNIPSNHIIGI